MRLVCTATLVLALVQACGGDDTRPPMDSGPVYTPAQALPQVAFEGQSRLAVELLVLGEDLTGATIMPEDAGGPLEIIEQRCRGERCGVVLRVRDDRPNMGRPIPATIDSERHALIIEGSGGELYRAFMTVFPLDTIDNRGTMPLSVSGVVLASAAEATAGSMFRATALEAPVRWVVFGDATFAGTIDASAEGAEPYAGGDPGGVAGAAAAAPQGGAAGSAGAGAGGGGAALDGATGAGADGTPDTGGAGGTGDGEPILACADTLEAESCPNGAGGGATGEGGASGGTLLIASLGTLDLGGELRARGGDGASDGGGGAGGNVLVAAPSFAGGGTIDASGGLGDGNGGDGADGRVRVDGPGSFADAWTGPAVDVSAVESLSDASTVTLTGVAAPDASITVFDIEGGGGATATAGPDGSFSVDYPLTAGINRLGVEAESDGVRARSWVGTNIQLEMVPSLMQSLPRGATIDIVHLP
jgi:hypothetical protein